MNRRSTFARDIGLAAIAVLLVLLQTLGMLHGLAHPAGGDSPKLSQFVHGDERAGTAVEPARASEVPASFGRLDGLFGSHSSGSADCRVFDHLLQLSVPGSAHPASLLAVSYAVPSAQQGTPIVACEAAAYLARGPPTFG